jgi:hypothetical protein
MRNAPLQGSAQKIAKRRQLYGAANTGSGASTPFAIRDINGKVSQRRAGR